MYVVKEAKKVDYKFLEPKERCQILLMTVKEFQAIVEEVYAAPPTGNNSRKQSLVLTAWTQ